MFVCCLEPHLTKQVGKMRGEVRKNLQIFLKRRQLNGSKHGGLVGVSQKRPTIQRRMRSAAVTAATTAGARMSRRYRGAQCVREFYPAWLRSAQSARATARSS